MFASLAAGWLGLSGGCGRPAEGERGVHLLHTGTELEPTSTFEFRFEQPVIEAAQVGTVARPCPLQITPWLPGEWTWLSRRSGVFRPSAPPRLGTEYRLSLAWGEARCERRLHAPPFGLETDAYRGFDTNDAPATPRLVLYFNANVSATDASSLLVFRDEAGQRVPALVRHATRADGVQDGRGLDGRYATWKERFEFAQELAGDREEVRPLAASEVLPHVLWVTPAQPLPPGAGWRLEIHSGLASTEPGLRLTEDEVLWVGTVRPFLPTDFSPRSALGSGRFLLVQFSKALSPELTASNLLDWFTVVPPPSKLRATRGESHVSLEGDFRLDEHYAVTVKRGLPARQPATLSRDVSATVTFAPLPPRLYFPFTSSEQLSAGQRRFDLLALNLPEARLRAKALDESALVPALRGYRSYVRQRAWEGGSYEPYQGIDFNVLPGRTIWQTNLSWTADLDHAERTTLSWDTVLGERRTAAVFLEALAESGVTPDRKRPGTQALVQLTDLGLYWKRSESNVSVLAFSYRSGRPLAGVKLRVVTDENGRLAEGETMATALTELPLDPRGTWLVAASGDDLRAAEIQSHELYVDGTRIPLKSPWDTELAKRRVLLFSERPVYRPGEMLHLKVLVRDQARGGWEIPRELEGRLTAYDARDRKFHDAKARFSALGSWDADVPLPRQVRGTYRVELQFGTNEVRQPWEPPISTYHHYFQVQDFTPDAFAVTLKVPEAVAAGQPVAIPVEARYLFGDEVTRASVRWTVRAEDDGFAPAGFDDFAFGSQVYLPGIPSRSASLVLSGETNYVRGQPLVLTPEIPLDPTAPQPRAVEVLVELTDLDQQTISARAGFRRDSARFYLGGWRGSAAGEVGKPWPIQLVAVDPAGRPLTNAVKTRVTLQRVDWRTVRVQGAGGSLDYRSEAVLQPLSTNDVLTCAPVWSGQRWVPASADESPATLTAPEAGSYVIEARAQDEDGRAVATSFMWYVYGPQRLAWDYRSPAVLDLVPDRTNYVAGETATLLLKAPFDGAAVISLEQESVLRSFVTNLTGNAPALQVPLTEAEAPAVYVSVMLLRGLEDSPRAVPEPQHALGYCRLNVERPATRLGLDLKLAAEDVRPGAPVILELTARDHTGAGVPDAELTVYAVDEGVLNLMDYAAPDPQAFFHAPRPLAVWSHGTLQSVFPEDPESWEFSNKGFLVGDGGKARVALRKNFLSCAYWNANLHPDAQGRLRVEFTAPDSLTRYRIFAVAQTARNQFGAATTGFRVNKPLMLQPAPPAFAHLGDRLVARAVVHNRTDQPGRVEITLETHGADGGPAEPGSAAPTRREVEIGANTAATVDFPVEFQRPGPVRWVWRARFAAPARDDFTDAVETTLEVNDPAPLLREVHLTRSQAGTTNLLAAANPQLLEGAARRDVTVRVSNSRLGELGDAVRHLLTYPYGCAEQTVSALVPWLALGEFTNGVPALARPPGEVRAAVERGLNRLFFMQTGEGGLGFWPGASQAGLWISAYAGVAFGLAASQGYALPAGHLDSLQAYLARELASGGRFPEPEELAGQALALWALTLGGKPQPGFVDGLFDQRHRMAAETRAVLALSLPADDTERIEELLRPKTKLPALEDLWFAGAARELAVRLMAWCRVQPDHPEVDRLVAELLDARRDGHWITTQGDAWALLGLAAYARQVEGALLAGNGVVKWAADERAFELPAVARTFETTFQASSPDGAPPLWLENPQQRRWFAQATITGHARVVEQPRQDRGFALQRRYELVADDGRLRPFEAGHVGDRVLVTLRLEVRQPAHFVAVDDPLPAVFEAVNPEFKSRATSAGELAGSDWVSDFRELRADRALFFCDRLGPGTYVLRYLARVRGAGEALAPAAKAEEMYHPERFGLTETLRVRTQAAP